ncbi:CMGC family protein kinase [Tritrichomonas foetus]|uniref:cyclin-dependent kinase n=1 Tax=Tritrichomonas foetus TaxID=1144522 RepID=A0A1J4K3Q4_9EUKA|nr:CMGC family protein kinase [Tritrichomonas foetus]|eukprot:OHT04380.1 CMGC family protein kinase [Tritrichomonas foetus]
MDSEKKDITRYTDRQKIGEGTYGEVYRAIDSQTGKYVALKIMKPVQEDDGISPLTLREISILKSVSHPNIVNLLDVVVNASTLILVFEYVPVDLQRYLRKMQCINTAPRSFEPKLLQSYSFQLLAATYILHTHQIIHRDIKPANLLISREGCLKLSDFGLARYFTLPLRQYSPNVVTEIYRAPELLFVPQCYDLGVDIWSVGCVIAEMARGVPLFHADSDLDLMHKMIETLGTPDDPYKIFKVDKSECTIPVLPPRPMCEVLNTDNNYLCDLVSALLAYDPAKRITAGAALKHPYFNDLTHLVKEMSLPPGTI